MIEPVHFNTNFIFRFGYNGISIFGGEEDSMIDIDTITWKEKHISFAFEAYKKMEKDLKMPEVNFNNFEKNKEGTYKLVNELSQINKIPKIYILGSVICHQLLYRVPLQATFLTGLPNDYSGSEYNDSDYE